MRGNASRPWAALGAILGALALAGCEQMPAGEVGTTATFDAAQASDADIAAALQRDGKVVLRGVLFATDSADLSPEGEAQAARLAAALNASPDIVVAIVGHTDNTGDVQYNMGLSDRRARALATALVQQHGISGNRLAPVGIGPFSPVAPNTTPDGRAQNRRVEVVLIG